MKKSLLILFNTLFALAPMSAATFTVTSSAPTGDNTLVAAITNAAAGDTIAFNFDGTEITLQDAITMKSLVVNGKNKFNDKSVIIKQSTATKSMITLATGITAKFTDLVFDGAGSGNTAITAANGSTIGIENCIFRNINAQTNNGGAARLQGVASIKNSSFENNVASGSYGGGAICIYNAADVTIDGCSFTGNVSKLSGTSKNGGGAIVARATVANPCNVTILNSTFANNAAGLTGGALMASVQSSSVYTVNVKAVNCTFTGNKGFGAICSHTTVKGNANIYLVNSIVLNNVDTLGTSYSDIFESKGSDASTVAVVEPHNVIYGVAPTIVTTDRNCIQIADPSNSNVFNAYEAFGSLKRPVLSTEGILSFAMISSASQAVNAGIATLDGYAIPSVDQIGTARPAKPSIGAVEYKAIGTSVPSVISDKASVYVKDNEVFVKGISEPALARIYSINGTLLKTVKVNSNSSISLSNVPGNLLLIKIGNTTFKVLNK